jgi:hypothetical protein
VTVGSDNSTVYWWTRGVGKTDQTLVVQLGAGFKGDLAKVGITPILPDTPPPGNQALPFPSQLEMTTQPGGQPVTLTLQVPPKFESLKIKEPRPQNVLTKLLANDPTAATGQCVQTALVFYQKH